MQRTVWKVVVVVLALWGPGPEARGADGFMRDLAAYGQPVPAALYRGMPVPMRPVEVPRFPHRFFPVTDYGAVPGGEAVNTSAFTQAIDACEAAGGGHVVVPPGIWLTGPLRLKSNVDFHVQRGALVVFLPRPDAYPLVHLLHFTTLRYAYRCTSPLFIEGAHNVAITGEGVFDGSGRAWRYERKERMNERDWRELVKSGGVVSADGKEWWPSEEARRGEMFLNNYLKMNREASIHEYAKARDVLRPELLKIQDSDRILVDGPTFLNAPRYLIMLVEASNVVVRNVVLRNPPWAANADGLVIRSSHDVVAYNVDARTGGDGISLKAGEKKQHPAWGPACENIVIADSTIRDAHGGFSIGSDTFGGARNVMVRSLAISGVNFGLRFKSAMDRGGVVEKLLFRDIAIQDVKDALLITPNFTEGPQTMQREPDGTSSVPEWRDIEFDRIVVEGARRAIAFSGLPGRPVRGIRLKRITADAAEGSLLEDVAGLSMNGVALRQRSGPVLSLRRASDVRIRDASASRGTEAFLKILDIDTTNIEVHGTDRGQFAVPVEGERTGAKPVVTWK